MTGEVELEDKVLVIRRIHVRMELKVTPEQGETAKRVHDLYMSSCPLYRTLRTAIAITSELALLPA